MESMARAFFAAPTGKGALMVVLTLDAVIGVVCGFWFRAGVLVPLMSVACLEAALLRRTGMGSSTLLLAIALVCLIEAGYLAGAVLAVWSPLGRRKSFRDFTRREQSRGWSHYG